MGLELYEVSQDKFDFDGVSPNGMDFPCCVCSKRHGSDTSYPCINCGHNAKFVDESDKE